MLVGKPKNNNSIMIGNNLERKLKLHFNIAVEEEETTHNVFLYFEEWATYTKSYNILDFPANLVTHMIYSFGICNPSQADYDTLITAGKTMPDYDSGVAEGTFVPHDETAFDQHMIDIATLMTANPDLKVLMSIGGYTLSWNLHTITASSTFRTNFAVSIVTFLIDNNLHGVDIDWEYLGSHAGASYNIDNTDTGSVQGANFKLFLARIRLEMDNRQASLLLTAVSGAQEDVLIMYNGCNQYLDYIGIMNYDYFGISWGGNYGHHCNIHHNSNYTQSSSLNAQSSLAYLLANTDIPVSKVNLGFPTYARGWRVDSINYDYPELSLKSTSQPSLNIGTDYTGESGIASYREIKAKLVDTTLKLWTDDTAKCSYAYDETDPTLWSLPHPEYFAQYYLTTGCAGIIVWCASDDAIGGNSLIKRFNNEIENPTTITPQPSISQSEISLSPLWDDIWHTGDYRIQDTQLGDIGDPDELHITPFTVYDATTVIQGWGFMKMYGDSILQLGGGAPRFYSTINVLNCQMNITWRKPSGTIGYVGQGCIFGTRSNHTGHSGQTYQENLDNPAHTYIFKYTYQGYLQIDFEPVHGAQNNPWLDEEETIPNPAYDLDNMGGILVQQFQGIPSDDTWYNLKGECYNDGGVTVLKLYLNGVLKLSTTHYHVLMYDNLYGTYTPFLRTAKFWSEDYDEFYNEYKDYSIKTITVN